MDMKAWIYRLRQWLRVRAAKRGKATWGRLEERVEVPVVGDISARVIRVDGTVEDLGVIARAEVGEK